MRAGSMPPPRSMRTSAGPSGSNDGEPTATGASAPTVRPTPRAMITSRGGALAPMIRTTTSSETAAQLARRQRIDRRGETMTTIATVEAMSGRGGEAGVAQVDLGGGGRPVGPADHAVVGEDAAQRVHDHGRDDRGGGQRGGEQVAAPEDQDQGGQHRQRRRDDERQADQRLLDAVGQPGEVAGDVLFDAAHGVLGVDGDREAHDHEADAAEEAQHVAGGPHPAAGHDDGGDVLRAGVRATGG